MLTCSLLLFLSLVLGQDSIDPQSHNDPKSDSSASSQQTSENAQVFNQSESLILEADNYRDDEAFQAAHSLYEQAASLGRRDALTTIGEMYLFGELETNYTLAFEYFSRAANLGDSDAQYYLGFLYSTGLSIHHPIPDQALAVLHYYFAAVGGSNRAKLALGYRHLFGYSTPKSCETAVLYYSQVAEEVVTDLVEEPLTIVLERVRLSDDSTRTHSQEDDEDIIQYWQHSADTGEAAAQVAMGQLHLYGARGVEQNPERAANYFRMAAQQGDTSAMSNLAQLYASGLGVENDNVTAFKYFTQAAQQGDSSAQNGLGYMYLHGYGTEQDYNLALRYFKKAAAQNNPEAQFNLGAMYFAGLGVEKKYSTSLQYFSLAAQQSHTRAIYNLGQMHLNGLGTVRACHIGIKLIKTVAERGGWALILKKAHRYFLNGQIDQALLLYAQAAEEGYELGQSNAAWLLDQGAIPLVSQLPSLVNFTTTTPTITTTTSEKTPTSTESTHNNPLVPERRHQLAWRYFIHASEQGSIDALRVLGDYAYEGLVTGVADYSHAARMYLMASDSRNQQSMFNLGYMHQHGIGVPQDFHLAKRYFDSASETAPEAYIPTQLALFYLSLHQRYLLWKHWWNGTTPPATIAAPASTQSTQSTTQTQTTQTSSTQTSSTQTTVDSSQHTFFETMKEFWELIENYVLLVLCLLLAVVVYYRANHIE